MTRTQEQEQEQEQPFLSGKTTLKRHCTNGVPNGVSKSYGAEIARTVGSQRGPE